VCRTLSSLLYCRHYSSIATTLLSPLFYCPHGSTVATTASKEIRCEGNNVSFARSVVSSATPDKDARSLLHELDGIKDEGMVIMKDARDIITRANCPIAIAHVLNVLVKHPLSTTDTSLLNFALTTLLELGAYETAVDMFRLLAEHGCVFDGESYQIVLVACKERGRLTSTLSEEQQQKYVEEQQQKYVEEEPQKYVEEEQPKYVEEPQQKYVEEQQKKYVEEEQQKYVDDGLGFYETMKRTKRMTSRACDIMLALCVQTGRSDIAETVFDDMEQAG
jgi:pentatricopeptide repeat protein